MKRLASWIQHYYRVYDDALYFLVNRFVRRFPYGLSILWPIVIVIVFLTLSATFIFSVPNHLVPSDLVPDATERVKIRHDDRATLLQSLTAFLILTGAYFSWHVTRAGHITDRFTRAIDQLGKPEIDIRLGGIYALERIARSSLSERNAIAQILTAYVRNHSPWPQPNGSEKLEGYKWLSKLRTLGRPRSDPNDAEALILQKRAPDIQASISILGRMPRSWSPTPSRLVLSNVDLRDANIQKANLGGAILYESNLDYSFLWKADLRKANLRGTSFRHAGMRDANFRNADLSNADLTGHLVPMKFMGPIGRLS